MTLFKQILIARWLRWAALIVLLQQVLVASATYLMAKLAVEAQSQGLLLFPAVLLFFCVTLPGTLVQFFLVRSSLLAVREAQYSYFARYISANQGKASIWRAPKERSLRHDVLCKSGQDTIQATIHFLVDVLATALNILLNTVSVVLVAGAPLGVAIAFAGAFGFLFIHLRDRGISYAAQEEMRAEGDLNAHLIRSWDNIVLGNPAFFARWKSRFEALFSASQEASLRALRQREGAVTAAGLLTNVFVVGFALAFAWMHRSENSVLVGLLVMLPRSLQIVMHIQVVQSYWAQWKSLRNKLAMAEEGTHSPEEFILHPFIKEEKLNIAAAGSEGEQTTHTALLELAGEERAYGRFIVSGANGSGKSTLLLDLKSRLGERAMYLPAQHELELVEGEAVLSSGQRTLSALQDLLRADAEVLLLDEWDANLSAENRGTFSEHIDEISQRRLVIEVRHGRDAL